MSVATSQVSQRPSGRPSYRGDDGVASVGRCSNGPYDDRDLDGGGSHSRAVALTTHTGGSHVSDSDHAAEWITRGELYDLMRNYTTRLDVQMMLEEQATRLEALQGPPQPQQAMLMPPPSAQPDDYEVAHRPEQASMAPSAGYGGDATARTEASMAPSCDPRQGSVKSAAPSMGEHIRREVREVLMPTVLQEVRAYLAQRPHTPHGVANTTMASSAAEPPQWSPVPMQDAVSNGYVSGSSTERQRWETIEVERHGHDDEIAVPRLNIPGSTRSTYVDPSAASVHSYSGAHATATASRRESECGGPSSQSESVRGSQAPEAVRSTRTTGEAHAPSCHLPSYRSSHRSSKAASARPPVTPGALAARHGEFAEAPMESSRCAPSESSLSTGRWSVAQSLMRADIARAQETVLNVERQLQSLRSQVNSIAHDHRSAHQLWSRLCAALDHKVSTAGLLSSSEPPLAITNGQRSCSVSSSRPQSLSETDRKTLSQAPASGRAESNAASNANLNRSPREEAVSVSHSGDPNAQALLVSEGVTEAAPATFEQLLSHSLEHEAYDIARALVSARLTSLLSEGHEKLARFLLSDSEGSSPSSEAHSPATPAIEERPPSIAAPAATLASKLREAASLGDSEDVIDLSNLVAHSRVPYTRKTTEPTMAAITALGGSRVSASASSPQQSPLQIVTNGNSFTSPNSLSVVASPTVSRILERRQPPVPETYEAHPEEPLPLPPAQHRRFTFESIAPGTAPSPSNITSVLLEKVQRRSQPRPTAGSPVEQTSPLLNRQRSYDGEPPESLPSFVKAADSRREHSLVSSAPSSEASMSRSESVTTSVTDATSVVTDSSSSTKSRRSHKRGSHARSEDTKRSVGARGKLSLGIDVVDVPRGAYDANDIAGKGAVQVISVARGGVAEQNGIFPGDVIVRVDEIPVSGYSTLVYALERVHQRGHGRHHVAVSADVFVKRRGERGVLCVPVTATL